MSIAYATTLSGITVHVLDGDFFKEWPKPPNPETLLRILQGSDHIVIALDDMIGKVIGYITAISDGVTAAYIPHLGVLPSYQGQGIGSELVRRLLAQLNEIYMIDLTCDEDVAPFYERLGFRQYNAMIIRNYRNQAGLRG